MTRANALRSAAVCLATFAAAPDCSGAPRAQGGTERPAADRPPSDRFGVMAVPADPRSLEALRDLGVGWVRFTSMMGDPARAAREQRTFRQIAGVGVGMWLTLTHRDRENAILDGSVGWDQAERGGFEPRDPVRYKEVVRATVRPLVEELRRLGRSPADWLVVQVENEVLPYDVASPDRPRRFWHGSGEGYLRMLALAYEAVKEVDRSIPVACFGFSSEMLEGFVAGRPREVVAWGERVCREGRFDVADVHLYHRIEEIAPKVRWVRERTGPRPLVATEVGGPDPAIGGDPADDAALAADLPRRMRTVLEAGADRAFWVLLVETTGADERFQRMALIDADWHRRPAFEAYRRVIAAAEGRDP